MLTDVQFNRTRRLASQLAGIELLDRHRELLDRRRHRLGITDAASLDTLLRAAEGGESEAIRRLIRLLATKFTGFFRHPRHFDIAAEHALRAAHERGCARVWSAAAATGEEPYSLAMRSIETFQQEKPPVHILATDVDSDGLATAQKGEYTNLALRSLGSARRNRFLLPTNTKGSWVITPPLRNMVEFREMNLVNPTWHTNEQFDVIFCRNVLMYFDPSNRQSVLERIAPLLAPDGLLVMDPVEHPGPTRQFYSSLGDGVYSLRSFSRPGSIDNPLPGHRVKAAAL